METRFLAFICVFGFLSLTAVGADCSLYQSCEECATQGCAWVTAFTCKEECRPIPSPGTTDTDLTRWAFRGDYTSSSSACVNHSRCTLKSYDNIDGNFELDLWKARYSKGAHTPLVSPGNNDEVQTVDGLKFVWFGKYRELVYQEVYQEMTIPADVTHLSFFLFASVRSSESVLAVYVDDDIVGYIDRERAEAYSMFYRNYDVNIKKYAGATHTIRLRGYNYAIPANTPTDFFIVDVFRLISDPSLGDADWHPAPAWPEVSQCSMGCSHPADSVCDPLCNNVMCGFDSGACDGMSRITIPAPGNDKIESGVTPCYSYQEPRDVQDKYVCPDYKKKTCCVYSAEVAFVQEQQFNVSKQCTVESQCQNVINRVLCAACSPRSMNFYSGGKLAICTGFASEMYEACLNSKYYNKETQECLLVSQNLNTASFIELFGTMASENCFDGIDAEPFEWQVWHYVLIAVGGAVIIAVIVVVIVVVCCKQKKKKNQKNNAEAGVDMNSMVSANNMTLVPVDIVGDPDKGEIICIDDGSQTQTVPVTTVGTVTTMDGVQVVSTGVPVMTVQQPMMVTMQQPVMLTPEQQMMMTPDQQMMMLMMTNGMMQMQMQGTDMQMQGTDMQMQMGGQMDQTQGQQVQVGQAQQ